MIERVHIVESWQTCGHQVVILGRAYPGAPRAWLTAAGDWETLKEGAVPGDPIGFRLPEGALDAIVAEYANVATPHPATERHLEDARTVRDRLLTLIEQQPAA